MTTRAQDRIGAEDLRAGHILIGDSISPTRYGSGVAVNAINNDIDGRVLVIADGQSIELLTAETVYVRSVK